MDKIKNKKMKKIMKKMKMLEKEKKKSKKMGKFRSNEIFIYLFFWLCGSKYVIICFNICIHKDTNHKLSQ